MNTPNNPQALQPLAPVGAPITMIGVERDVATNTILTLAQQLPGQMADAPSAPGPAGRRLP